MLLSYQAISICLNVKGVIEKYDFNNKMWVIDAASYITLAHGIKWQRF